jgi:hypothetical protein
MAHVTCADHGDRFDFFNLHLINSPLKFFFAPAKHYSRERRSLEEAAQRYSFALPPSFLP